MILFAIAAIAIGANLLTKVKTGSKPLQVEQPAEPETPAEANITIEFESEPGQIKVNITSEKEIQNIDYWWDDEEPTSLQPNDTQYDLNIPSKQGTHVLNIEVLDIEENIKTVNQTVIGDSVPELELTVDGISNYVIKAKDDELIDKIVVVLNDETQEIEVNGKEYEGTVPIPEGDSIIDVTVYNLNGLTANKKGRIKGFHKQ